MKYPVNIEKDGDSFMVSFPDLPEALTCGDTYEESLDMAHDALITAFDFYFEDQRPVPMPSNTSKEVVSVPPSVWAKVLLLNTMLETKVTQSELARRMGTRKQEVQRIVDLHHSTKIDRLADALAALHKQFTISIA
ncbi:type II toxin-antitoxin system HicB family antitoxin [Shewanella halifaxensis]|uniref:type II toxin-antitoxin system HicB family antitoxin n=1 Tax=Shewanella halifaxensis TaxID=271098 RepID=UPI0013A62B4C|nr:type II toxin-antitoxin system HicB family antitoxin [Shewanella halifaxensis]